MTRSRWIIFAVIVLVTLGGLVALSNRNRIDVSKIDPATIVKEGDTADNIYGKADAKVVLIEYADFQCPGCGGAFPNLSDIKEDYKDHVAFVFRHFPLRSIHPNAFAASSVAEAAGAQGKFWEMHDLLFQNQSNWQNLSAENRNGVFEGYASQLGLDITRFKTDLASDKIAYKVRYHEAVGGKAGVNSTPTFYLNGEELDQEVTLNIIQQDGAKLREQLDAAIREAGGTPPTANTESAE